MSENEEEVKKDLLSSMYFKGSLFLLLFGFIFTLGQTIYLNSFIYLNTFTYIDFLINSILIAPFVLLISFLVGFIANFLVEPMSAIYNLYLVFKIDDKKSRGFWFGLIHSILEILKVISIPTLIVLIILLPSIKYFYFLIIGWLILLIILRYLSKKIELYAVNNDSAFLKKMEEFPGEIIANFTDVRGVITACMLILFFGFMYIAIQDESTKNATIIMGDGNKKIEVHILTSNSNFIVAYRDDKIELIPRSEIKAIRHDSIYMKAYGKQDSNNKP